MKKHNEILLMNGIKKRFPGVLALDDVTLSVKKGEVHVLLGENGAGKSTLMKILSGAYVKDDGGIYIDGEKIEIESPSHAQDLGIGIIYQEFNLNIFLTVAENIYLGREPVRIPGIINWSELNKNAQKILDDLNVGIDAKQEVGTLGVAKQQMVEVAKALSLDARILIMDEPTASLSNQEIQQLFKTINQLKGQGVSIIYISHRLEEIFEIGDRVTVLRDGKYVGTHKVSDLTHNELVKMMVDRDLSDHIPKEKTTPGETILRLEKVSVENRLKNISFELHRGEVLGIAGLMGAGRTRLARTIFGVEEITEGAIYINGEKKNSHPPVML